MRKNLIFERNRIEKRGGEKRDVRRPVIYKVTIRMHRKKVRQTMEVKDMFVKGLSHIGIPTRNLEESLEFYKGLGFEVSGMGNEGKKDAVAFVEQQGVVIELYLSDEKQDVTGVVDHVALDVDDIEGAYLWAREKGYKIITPGIVCVPDVLGKGTSYFMIEGCNHERIEFNKMS